MPRITDIPDTNQHFHLHGRARRRWTSRLWAAVGALALNIALFALMPHLQQTTRATALFDEPLANINVVRIKRPDSMVKRKTDPPPEPPAPKEPLRPAMQQPLQARLNLPFEINPRLPAGPNTLVLPPPDTGAFDTGSLENAFSVGDLDAPLTVLARVPPVYPLRAKHRGIEGWARVRFIVNEDGGVSNAAVMESEPPDIFDQNVIRCVNGWRFKPGTVDGMPVRTWAETTIHFNLE